MFMRVLSAMMAADWIDRVLRGRQQRQLAKQWARYAAQPPPHGPSVDRRAEATGVGWDPRAPERPS
jgi:hypothetical protein